MCVCGGGGGGGGGDTCVIMWGGILEGGHTWCYVKDQYTVPHCLERVLL